MKEPIKAKDMCHVVSGLGRHKSPNVGKVVTVVSFQGEHSQHGKIWRCEGEGIQQLSDNGEYVLKGWADIAEDWLRKIEPPALPPKHRTRRREIA